MKKILILLLLAAIVAPVFADDALMLPQSVWRVRLIPSVTLNNQAFDDDGDLVDIGAYDSAAIYNLSFALEYGVNSWITAAMQWTPGWRFASSFDGTSDQVNQLLQAGVNANPLLSDPQKAGIIAGLPENDKLSSTGLNDLFVGAKVQIVGEEAPVVNARHRFALATGAILPLSTYDADEETENYLNDKDYQPERVDNDVVGIGGRLYYDYVVSDSFFVNYYNEFIYYLPRDLESFGVTIDQTTGQAVKDVSEKEYEFGYDLTFEVEPTYATMVGDGLELGVSLPLTFTTSPKDKVDGDSVDNSDSYSFSVAPSVNLFAQSLPWPIDFQVAYSIPVAGKNTQANHTVVLQIKNYLKFW